MNKWAWMAAIATLIGGASQIGMAGEPVIRAQGGVVYPESYPAYEGEYYEGDYCEECEPGFCSPFAKIKNSWRYMTTLGGKQPGYGQLYGGATYGRDPRQLDYRYMYRYRAPKDLRYPAPNQPAGVVVYPYYTVKGPDDFFLNEKLD